MEAHGCSLGMGTQALVANCSVRLTLCPLQLDGGIRTNDLAFFQNGRKVIACSLFFLLTWILSQCFLTCKLKCFV